jgi:Putative zincin peptidase
MEESRPEVPSGEDRSISLARANVLTLAISLPLVGLMVAAYLVFSPARGLLASGFTLPGGLAFLVLMIAGIVAHEGVHALAWSIFGRLPLKRIRFGFQAATLTPYAHALDPMPARAYRLGALMPAIVLGVVPFAVGTLVGSPSPALYGMIFVFAAGGDLLVLRLLHGVDARALVLDHPSRAGCIVLAHPSN